MKKAAVKEGPIVFLRNVLVMEVLATLLFFGASFLENYEMIFHSWGLANYIRYDIFVIISFSAFQLIYIVALFLDWYFTYYEIHETEIVRKSGLIFRRRKSVSLGDVTSVETYQSPLGRMMYHATIILEHGNGRVTKIKNVGNFEEYVHIIKQAIRSSGNGAVRRKAEDLIAGGEGLYVEFKETLRYDVRKGEVSRDIEKSAMKSVVGFLNADGGSLLLGVGDGGEIKGLDMDFKNLPKKNRDGLENHISMLVKTMIGLAFTKYVSVSFERLENKEVCVISVKPSHKPAYLMDHDKKEEFFVRVGNSTQPFSMSQAEEYIKTHWK